MEGISSLDLHYLAKELQVLVHARLDKIYQSQDTFIFSFYLSGQGKQYLHVALPSFVFLAPEKTLVPEESGFCGILRKYCSNKKLESITQYQFERILVLDFNVCRLVIELFDKGNIILIKPDSSIISAHLFKKFRFRTIRGGIPYAFPQGRINPRALSLEQLNAMLHEGNQEIVKTLAKNASLGGKYAEEVCLIAKIDKNAKQLSQHDLESLHNALKTLFEREPSASLYANTFSPFILSSQETPEKTFSSFNALVMHLSQEGIPIINVNPAVSKIKNILEKQQEALLTLEKEQAANTAIANKIYEHYIDLNKVLQYIQEHRKKKGLHAIKEELAKNKILLDEKSGKISVDLP